MQAALGFIQQISYGFTCLSCAESREKKTGSGII
jgi:hypothetical protein